MTKGKWRRLLVILGSTTVFLVFGLAIIGATWGRGFMAMVGRDKDLVRETILDSHRQKATHADSMREAREIEAKLGRFQSIIKILGEASLEDGLSGKNEYSYFAYCQFENGEGTYVFRIGNPNNKPVILGVEAEPGHKPRRRIRHIVAGQLR